MAIATTGPFELERVKTDPGYEPIYLVEIHSVGTQAFFATDEPAFVGKWTAGDGLVAGGDIKANDDYPTYNTFLHQLRNGGIAPIRHDLDPAGFARTGDTQIRILNQELFNHITDSAAISNAFIRVRLGFRDTEYKDYIDIFSGRVDDFVANYDAMTLEAIDDTVKNLIPIPPQFGADFFPQSITVGGAIPIVLGDIDRVPFTQTVGDVTGTLAREFTALDDSLFIYETTAPFPPSGELTITPAGSGTVETLTYETVQITIIQNVALLEFTDLTRTAPTLIAANAEVDLTSIVYQYVNSIGPISLRRIRELDNLSHPTAAPVVKNVPLEPSGTDWRKVRVAEFTASQNPLMATVASEDRAPNLILNGEGDGIPGVLGWTVINGAWDSFTPAGESEPVIRGTAPGGGPTPAELVQDIPTVEQAKYRITFSMRKVTGGTSSSFITLRIGTAVSPAAIYDFGQFDSTVDTPFELVFSAISTSTRITLIADKGGGGGGFSAYWDHIQVYDVTSENPALMIRSLINRHAPTIGIDEATFDEAEIEYNDSGSRLAGVLEETEELQSLLGRIAQQFRAKTFLGEDGNQRWKFFSNSANAITRFGPGEVDKGSMRVTQENIDTIYTRFFVYFNRDPSVTAGTLGGRTAYRGVLFATPDGTNSVDDAALQLICQQARDEHKVDRVFEVFADFIPDAGTASSLLSLITRLGTHRRVIVDFTSYLNASPYEIGDIVRIAHPLIPPSANNVTYEILAKESIPNGCFTAIQAAEIRQSAFNSFTEKWEPEVFVVPSLVQFENWEAPPPPVLFPVDDACNPFTENWEPVTTLLTEHFNYWTTDTPGVFGGTPVEITRAMTHGWNFEDATAPATVEQASVSLRMPIASQVQSQSQIYHRLDYTDETSLTRVVGPGTHNAMQFNNNLGSLVGQGVRLSNYGLTEFDLEATWQFWVYLDVKNDGSMPIYQSRREVTLGSRPTDEDVYLSVWYDAPTDRFKLSVADRVVGGGSLIGQAFLDAMGNTLVASTLGSPALATWYHLVVGWDPATSTVSLSVNDVAETPVVVTPDFDVTFVTNVEPAAAGTSTNGTQVGIMINAPRSVGGSPLGWTGRMALLYHWQRLLTSAEITAQYAGGAGASITIT